MYAVADPGSKRVMPPPPSPVKISHKKDGQRQPHKFHVSWSLPYPTVESATGTDNTAISHTPLSIAHAHNKCRSRNKR